MKLNHGRARTGLTNVRPDWEWRQRKRRASALVCGSKHRAEAGGGAGVVQGMGSADSIQSGDTAARRGLI